MQNKMTKVFSILVMIALMAVVVPFTFAAPPAQEGTAEPTMEGTMEATEEAAQEATAEPTMEGTMEATMEATMEPTMEATAEPTMEGTMEATMEATMEPTMEGTMEATMEATMEPTMEATMEATMEPTMEATMEAEATEEAMEEGMEGEATAAGCADVYTVQADDWLSKLADRYFGDILAYPAIVDATNAAATEDDAFATIDDPDFIEIGWQLCIPESAGDAQAMPAEEGTMEEESMEEGTMEEGTMEPEATEEAMEEGTMEEGTMEEGAAEEESASPASEFDVPEGKALFVFVNESSADFNIDVGPHFMQVAAGATGQLELDPGTYTWQGHSPGGGFFITDSAGSRSFEVTVEAGDVHIEGVQ